MIELSFAPLGWYERLNQLQPNPFLDTAIKMIADPQTDKQQWETTLRLFQAACQALDKPIVEAYYLTKASQAVAGRDDWLKAAELVDKGLKTLKEKHEHLAILEWIGGAIDWNLRNGYAGCKHWQQAEETMEAAEKNAMRSQQEDRVMMIRECLKDMKRWIIEITASVEGGYLLINQYQKSRLTHNTSDLIQLMKKVLKSDQSKKAYQIIELLKMSSFVLGEYPEVMVECALAAYRLGDLEETILCLRMAKAKYAVNRENLAATLWMLGSVFWQMESGTKNAVESWTSCQEQLTNLVSDLDRVNSKQNREKKILYEYLLVILKLVTETRVEAYGKKV